MRVLRVPHLAVCGLAFFASLSCDDDSHSISEKGEVPFARDPHGRRRMLAACEGPIVVEFIEPRLERDRVRRAARRAVAAWKHSGIPAFELRFVPSAQRELTEDSRNQIILTSNFPGCVLGRCTQPDWKGVTRHYSVPHEKMAKTVEVDVWLHEDLRDNPDELTSVLVHELGHVLGLDHPKTTLAAEESVMSPDPAIVAHQPGRLDLLRVRELYAACKKGS